MKPYSFENAPLLKAFSERPGSDNELDRRRVNERRNRIETDYKWDRVRVNSAWDKQELVLSDIISQDYHRHFGSKPG